MTVPPEPAIQPYGDGAILATFGHRIDESLSRRIGALVAALDAQITAGTLPGVIDLVPSYTTLVVIFDPRVTDGAGLGAIVRTLWSNAGRDERSVSVREVEIPVCYGGEHGPDLAAVAAHTGLTPAEVIARHAAGRYVVGALGFSPGFAFLIGLDPALATPRRATPRTSVPPGSVGIGGAQTGVYAQATPGGWALIGRTPLRLARLETAEPADAFLMHSGDAIRFVPIEAERFAELEAGADPGRNVDRGSWQGAGDPPGPVALEVIAPGLQSTVQDLGRPGLGRFGISPGGAADRAALVRANRAVGNPDEAAALEITMLGPTLRAVRPVRIAIAGADLGATVNGFALRPGSTLDLHAGDTIAFDPGRAVGGVRAYLALAGGIDVPVVMGSRATDLTAGMGGLEGRPIRAGDPIRILPPPLSADQPVQRPSVRNITASPSAGVITLRVVRGPQADRFDPDAWSTFLHVGFTVSSTSDRMGLRLDGPAIMPRDGADLISEGIVTGAIQVTNGGQPIVMLPARATIGGYAKIATVITADLDRLGQARPGETIRFREVTVEEAMASARDEQSLGSGEGGRRAMAPGDWEALLALVRDFPSLGMTAIDIEVPTAGIALRLSRSEDSISQT